MMATNPRSPKVEYICVECFVLSSTYLHGDKFFRCNDKFCTPKQKVIFNHTEGLISWNIMTCYYILILGFVISFGFFISIYLTKGDTFFANMSKDENDTDQNKKLQLATAP